MTTLGDAFVKTTIAVTNLERAKKFYGNTLGLREIESPMEEGDALYQCGHGAQVYLYERPDPSGSTATVCSFEVDNVEGAVKGLRNKGVTFEEYNMPNLKTENGVATMGDLKAAWFKDPDGNILAVANSPVAHTAKTAQSAKARA